MPPKMSFMGLFGGGGGGEPTTKVFMLHFVALSLQVHLTPADVFFHVIYILKSPDFWKPTWEDGYFLSVVNLLFLGLGSGFPMALAFYIFSLHCTIIFYASNLYVTGTTKK